MYIYLDVDGVMTTPRNVMNRETGYLSFTEESVRVLKEIVGKYNGKIIVSSSWKEYKSVEYLKEKVFEFYDLDAFVVGKTPDICSTMREEEILEDIFKRNLNLNEVLVIDDLIIDGVLKSRHLKTELFKGLDKSHLIEVDNILNNKER